MLEATGRATVPNLECPPPSFSITRVTTGCTIQTRSLLSMKRDTINIHAGTVPGNQMYVQHPNHLHSLPKSRRELSLQRCLSWARSPYSGQAHASHVLGPGNCYVISHTGIYLYIFSYMSLLLSKQCLGC